VAEPPQPVTIVASTRRHRFMGAADLEAEPYPSGVSTATRSPVKCRHQLGDGIAANISTRHTHASNCVSMRKCGHAHASQAHYFAERSPSSRAYRATLKRRYSSLPINSSESDRARMVRATSKQAITIRSMMAMKRASLNRECPLLTTTTETDYFSRWHQERDHRQAR
jgi:hypothetical protein